MQWAVGEPSKNSWHEIGEMISSYYEALLDNGIPPDIAGAIVSNYAGMLNVVIVQGLAAMLSKHEAPQTQQESM